MEYLINSAIGAGAGWLMGQLKQGGNFGTIGNLISGVLGGNAGGLALGGTLAGVFNATSGDSGMGNIGTWLASAVGSMAITWLSKFVPGGSGTRT